MNFWNKQFLSSDDLKAIAGAIGKAENTTSGEIRVVVRHRRRWNERKLFLHDLALKEFYSLGMEKTRDRTGILILVLFAERKFHIVADEGIHAKVEDGTWDAVAEVLASHFSKRRYRDGICETIAAVGKKLSEHFPRKADDTNELPNDVILR